MVDETVFWRIMLCLQSPEERLLSSQNLNGTCWVLGQTQQTAGMADQPRSDELSDQGRQIWRDSNHTIPKVLGELSTIVRDVDYLVAEGVNVCNIGIRDFGTHRNFGGGFENGFDVFGEDGGKVGAARVGSEACTH